MHNGLLKHKERLMIHEMLSAHRFMFVIVLPYQLVLFISNYSLSKVDFVEMVLEWSNELVPSWQVAGDVHLNELSEPGHVLDFLFLELEVGEEASAVEATLEAH